MTVTICGDTYRVHNPRERPERIYLRYGLFKWMRRSHNYVTGEPEVGISVYRARYLDDGSVTLAENEEPCDSLNGQGRLCFVVTGHEVGTGSDGEPVLAGVKLLGYAIHRECARY